jgi:alpha-1,6-mannosyltransferase
MKKIISLVGLANLLVLAAHSVLSYLEARVAGGSQRPYGQLVFSDALAERVYPLSQRLQWVLRGDGVMSDPKAFLVVYSAPLILATLGALGLLLYLSRHRPQLDEDTPRRLLRWSWAFVIPAALAMPVLVQDFWLTIAWGRTLWWGANPYYDVPAQVPAQAVVGLPFDAPILKMSYGPLWAHLSHLVFAAARGRIFVAALIWKVLLAAAWCALLWLVHALTRRPGALSR